MSSQTLPESPPVRSAPETAPSQLAADEPGWARTLGLAGLMLTVFGLTVVTANSIFERRFFVGRSAGLVLLAMGVLGMLFHAIRDPDHHVRRAYGTIGFVLIACSGLLPLGNPANFLLYGWACSLGGLCFLLALSRHETDPVWRRRILTTLGFVGVAMAASGIIGGVYVEGFMLTYGSLLGILGLLYLCAFSSQHESSSEAGYKTGLALGAAAVFVILYALIRSIAPAVIKMNVAPFFIPTGLLLMVVGTLYGAVALGIASDNRFVVLTRRELGSYFYSPIAYFVMLGMAFLGFGAFFIFVNFIRSGTYHLEPIVLHYFQDLPPFIVILVVPAITMRLLAEEKRSGTYEVLMCAPVKEWTVVLSKYAAALIFFMLLWSLWTLYLIALRVESGKEFDYRPMLSFYLALALCGSSFISMGLFFSSLTKNQIIGAVLTFMGMLFVTIVGSVVPRLEDVGPLWKDIFRHLSYLELWVSSLKGRLHVREMILQGSFTFFWLFLTVKVLEARKWS